METRHYSTKEERQAAIKDCEGHGLTMRYDNFGTGPNGSNEMGFDVSPIPAVLPADLQQLDTLITSLPTGTIKTIATLLRGRLA